VQNVKHSCYCVLFPICTPLDAQHRKRWFCQSITDDGAGLAGVAKKSVQMERMKRFCDHLNSVRCKAGLRPVRSDG